MDVLQQSLSSLSYSSSSLSERAKIVEGMWHYFTVLVIVEICINVLSKMKLNFHPS
jgi:hypothetical protein